jgi:hypothetical protein
VLLGRSGKAAVLRWVVIYPARLNLAAAIGGYLKGDLIDSEARPTAVKIQGIILPVNEPLIIHIIRQKA